MKTITFIVGPTASGKTAYSIDLAKKEGAEIISADSMQIYKYMDIGTAKPDEAERGGVPHHMIDILYPNECFSVAQYKEMALEKIREVSKREKAVIVVGGTGLYINSLIYNISYDEDSYDPKIRLELEQASQEFGNAYLHDKLREADPEAAERIHVNDKKRTIRALEIYMTTGVNATAKIAASRSSPPGFEYEILGMEVEREELYKRIEKRVDIMLEAGLLDEVKKLRDMGYASGTAMQAIGYKELNAFLLGETSLDEAVEIIKTETRRYAKRQMTWFRKTEGITWITQT